MAVILEVSERTLRLWESNPHVSPSGSTLVAAAWQVNRRLAELSRPQIEIADLWEPAA